MKLLSLTILTVLLCSCRELVTSEFPEFPSVPVVNSILISGEQLNVHVSLTSKIDTGSFALVGNATISLYRDGVFIEHLEYAGEGTYLSDHVIEPAAEYSCEIDIPGYERVLCSDSLPAAESLAGIVHINIAGKDEEGMTYPSVQVSFTNNPLRRQYFEIVLKAYSRKYESHATLEAITDRVLLNEGLPLLVFSNELITDPVYTMNINYFTGGSSIMMGMNRASLMPLIVELRSVSYEYYRFIRQNYVYERGREPEFGPVPAVPLSLYSNIKNGYGIFAGYSFVRSDTLFPKYENR